MGERGVAVVWRSFVESRHLVGRFLVHEAFSNCCALPNELYHEPKVLEMSYLQFVVNYVAPESGRPAEVAGSSSVGSRREKPQIAESFHFASLRRGPRSPSPVEVTGRWDSFTAKQ